MNDAVLLELAKRWERMAETPDVEDEPAGQDGFRMAAKKAGRRETLRECADGLRILVQMIGDK